MTEDLHLWLTDGNAQQATEEFAKAGGKISTDTEQKAVTAILFRAPSLWPLLLSQPRLLTRVLETPLDLAWQRGALDEKLNYALKDATSAPCVKKALRHIRHQALLRIALRETLRLADVEASSAEMSTLADALVEAALRVARRTLSAVHGLPCDAQGQPVPIVVLGMGKLGGSELNLGSDIDLCFFYLTDDGATTGEDSLSVHEYYTRVVRYACQLLSDITEDGFCFRVDLRLRPEGRSGPLVNSMASAERYYESWGQTWERAALLRARPIAGDMAFGATLLRTLAPFIYRRQVNPRIATEMGSLLFRSRNERGVDPERDIKLGEGGIREAEFFVQSLQLIWGGRHPQLQVAGTIDALHALRNAGLISDRESESFTEAWAFLRRLEHAIHLQHGYQTHLLPTAEAQQRDLAASLGLLPRDLVESLAHHRALIHALFRTLDLEPVAPSEEPLEALWDMLLETTPPEALREHVAQTLHASDSDEALSHLKRLAKRADYPLGKSTRNRRPKLGLALLREARDSQDSVSALYFFVELFDRFKGAASYAQWLADSHLLRRITTLFANSPYLSRQLVSHPDIIEGLLNPAQLIGAQDISEAHTDIRAEIASLADMESIASRLRALKRDSILRIGLGFVNGEIEIFQTGRLLSHLADQQLITALDLAMHPVFSAQPGWPAPIVCALGKLGGRELGFGSDLDVFFLYDQSALSQEHQGLAIEAYSKIAQCTLRLLSQPDAQGPGYELDTRLRPSGRQGLLVASIAGFEQYHRARAAPWERQALIRARPVTANLRSRNKLSSMLNRLVFQHEPPRPDEVARLRGRMQRELGVESPDRYDPKYGYGGLVDIEFVVQWLQMTHGENSQLQTSHTHDSLLLLGKHRLLSAAATQALSEAYVWFRTLEQFLQLMSTRKHVYVSPKDPMLAKLAFALRVRQRDGMPSQDVLVKTYQKYAERVRSIFEATFGDLELTPPWRSE
ncbi:MAG: bifunctional [glutamate--ammonia ligase]-adenylyl-L-tyrosine phosphorylase/[glutamate--ammonia-ligase] adenylyltransferase [Myxococcales bacterium]|nr:bifunctional [glutamate--ammonia ligase]-adenylyl-L-tyrosine phosphorylase/[glutamate--ammonia-ligase] adenylyltransferase [Myxococcales bacterium]